MVYCKNCGEPFWSEEERNCSQCGAVRDTGNKFCYNCGFQVNPGEKYCQTCGVNLSSYHTSQTSSSYTTSNNDNYGSSAYGYDNECSSYDYANTENPYYDANGTTYGVQPYNKSKILAGILAIFFGSFGIHNFYLGYRSKGITQLTLSIIGWVTSCLGVGIFLSWGIQIWGFVEGIMILTGKIDTDANGNHLNN